MNCKELEELVIPLLDGELTLAQEREAAKHLETCLTCQTLVNRLSLVEIVPPSPVETPKWSDLDSKLDEVALKQNSLIERFKSWFSGEITIQRRTALLYLFIFAIALIWGITRPKTQSQTVFQRPGPEASVVNPSSTLTPVRQVY